MTPAIARKPLIDHVVPLPHGAQGQSLHAATVRRPRVLHVFRRLERGGAELRTLDVLHALGDHPPVETHILVHSGRTGELDGEFRAAGATLHHLPLTAVSFAPRFLGILRREEIDVVHSHVQYFSGWLLMLAAVAGVRTRIANLWITKNPPTRSPLRAMQRRIGRALLGRFATCIVAVSRDTMAVAFKAGWERDARCRVIYGGIPAKTVIASDLDRMRREARAELGFDENAIVVVHAGRFDPAKNHQRVIGIFSALVRRVPEARLLLVGGGDRLNEQRVREEVMRLGLHEQVTFTGTRSDVPRLLAASDVLLFPSTREGMPGVLLEALSAGTPCVASAIAGTRELAAFSSAIELVDLAAPDAAWASRVEAAAHDRTLEGRIARARGFDAASLDAAASAAALSEEWLRS